jgi:hypothetical protein
MSDEQNIHGCWGATYKGEQTDTGEGRDATESRVRGCDSSEVKQPDILIKGYLPGTINMLPGYPLLRQFEVSARLGLLLRA